MSSRKSNVHNVLEKNILIHLIKAKEMVVLQFTLGNQNQAFKYSQTLFYTFVFLEGVFCNGLPCSSVAVQETRVQSLGWEDPLKKGMATHSSILAWRIPWTENLAGYRPWGCKSQTQLSDSNSTVLLQFVLCLSFICCL